MSPYHNGKIVCAEVRTLQINVFVHISIVLILDLLHSNVSDHIPLRDRSKATKNSLQHRSGTFESPQI